jgi:hypothetical protein
MLVTQTVREIVPMLPRLRIVAVSMQRLKVRPACMTAIAIDMINFNPIRHWFRFVQLSFRPACLCRFLNQEELMEREAMVQNP